MENANLSRATLWTFFAIGIAVLVLSATTGDKFEQLNIGHENWAGTVLFSLIAIVLFWLFRKVGIDEFKLRIRRIKIDRPALYFVLLFLTLLFYYSYMFKGHTDFDLENFFFELTMPGVSEELLLRGLLLGILNRLFTKKFGLFGVKFGWGLIWVSVVFGLLHVLNYIVMRDPNIDQLLFILILTTAGGFLFGYIAEATGGLLLSILAHNALNVAQVIFSAFT